MKRRSRQSGFTLVEVVMALAIAASAVVLLLALLPGTADAIGDSHRTGRALTCVELVLADVRAADPEPEEGEQITTPLMGIVFPSPGEEVERTVYFDEDGVPVATEADAHFRVTLDLRRSGLDGEVLNIDCEARWPAAERAVRAGAVSVWGVHEL